MTEAKSHTPGPWTAREQRAKEGTSLGWIIEYPGGRIGWSSYATAIPNEGEGWPYTIGGINAHLIAAAPDLLAALKKLSASHLATIVGEGFDPEHCVCSDLDDACAATHKAEGRSMPSPQGTKT